LSLSSIKKKQDRNIIIGILIANNYTRGMVW